MVDFDLSCVDTAPVWRPQPLGLACAALVSGLLWFAIIAAARQLVA